MQINKKHQISDQKLIEEAEVTLKKLKKVHKDENWVKFSSNPCQMYKMQIGNRLLSKGSATIALPLKKILDRLTKQEILKQLNSQLTDCKLLHKLFTPSKKQCRVNYLRYHGLWPVEDRDFVNISILDEQDPLIAYIATSSCSYPFPQQNKVTRGTIHIAGYILQRKTDQSTVLTYISDVDLAGSIPQMFKNKLTERQASMPKQIENVILGGNYEQDNRLEEVDQQWDEPD